MSEASTATTTTPSRRPPAFVNKIMGALLRSPFHGLFSNNMMLITFTGRKSGKQFTTPVTYTRSGDAIVFFSSQRWWKNLQGGAPVTLYIKGREVRGIAEPTQDIPTIMRETKAFLAKKGLKNARMIGLQIDTSREPTEAELTELTKQRVVVFIKPQQA